MTVSKAKDHAIAARNKKDPKEAIDELAAAILELAAAIRKLEGKLAPP